jgi:hypothetical protein
MILLTLLKQNWQKTVRARGFHNNLAVNILLGIVALYFIVIFFALGLFLSNMLSEIPTEKTPTQIFNGITLYILFGGLAIRFMMQQLATINIKPYQTLPVKRNTIINYLLFSPLLNPINYVIFFVIIPFAIRSVLVDYNGLTAFCFILNFFFIVCFNSLVASFLKRKFGSNFWGFLGVVLSFGAIIALEYFKIFSLYTASEILFDFIVFNPMGLLIPMLAIGFAYLLNCQYFEKNYYAEKFDKKIKTEKIYSQTNLSFLNRFGTIGEIISLEMKVIWRHKRARNTLYVVPFFFLYGLIFYTNDMYAQSYGWIFFCAMFMTGAGMLIFCQWIIGMNSAHFDSLMTRNISIRFYLTANLYLILAVNVLCFIITIPYFLFGKDIALIHIAAFLYNCGVNAFLLIYFATFNTKRIELSVGSAVNFQGVSFKNFLVVIPIMFLPMIIVGIFSIFNIANIALIIFSVMGILGLVFQKQLITVCVNKFNARKYVMCEGFRQME